MVIPDKNTFLSATKEVIKRLEGGYFHPNMYLANPKKFALYTTSGETMFGLDRHAGHGYWYSSKKKSNDVQTNLKYIPGYKFKNESAKKFWTTLDKLNAANKWPHLYRGGNYENELTELAADSMYPVFMDLMNQYFTDEAKKMIFNDPRLLFHFIYATWNGTGFFKYYAQNLLKKLKTTKNADEIVQNQVELRKNSKYKQIQKSGSLFDQLFKSNEWNTIKKGFGIIEKGLQDTSGLITIFAAIFLYFLWKK